MGPGAGLARAAPVRPREGNAQSHEFLRPFGGYLMGPVRFGLRSGFFFLVLAGVAAPLAMTTNAAEGRHHSEFLRNG
jgi:hypothetical protein